MHFSGFALLSSLLAGLSVSTNADPGLTVAVISETEFCTFLPPAPGEIISDWEWDGVAFCTQAIATAPGAQILPAGFILSAHFEQGPDYVQITGVINPNIYVNATDEGGQFDTRAPVNATCAGYTSFVNLVEPSNPDFCIRCCNGDGCPTGKSADGCARIVPGDYSGPPVPSQSGVISSSGVPSSAVANFSSILTSSVAASSGLPSSSMITSSLSSSAAPTTSSSTVPTSVPIILQQTPTTSASASVASAIQASDAFSRNLAPATMALAVVLAVAVVVF
ncbi:hypothetical protein BC937DRAFT_88107 [Endogone sp. FLAS-F59071]|nr:hypothetical protein BC937DRAFT_88107 [Endogone sp. FLAS-F59071]|eukprot:RUS22658.1 hypothetical protein BC937DRAFT_88107 [Endogone sp. FLAS-F59071]